uniref:Uncharacterized protein n=1 Tax=Magallana gigas TaxID=29159 RepID=A0A8W8KTK0_MAGGI
MMEEVLIPYRILKNAPNLHPKGCTEVDTNWKEKERKTKRDLEKINRERNEGEQLDMGTGSEMVTGQTNMKILGIFLIHGSPVFNNVHFFLKACLHIIWQVIVLKSYKEISLQSYFDVKRSLLLCCPFSLHQDGDQSTLYLLKRFICPRNSETTKRIVKAVRDAYGGREKCPFSNAEIEGACKRYFKSLRDAERRKEKGTKQNHVIITRRQNRRRERAERLRKALPKANYTTKCMEKVEPILAAQYMSSEESDTEGEEKVFRVRQLPWQRLKVRKMKKTLEDIYHEQLPDHLKENKRRRILSDVPSRRKPPSNCPDWVIRSDWDANEDRESENERGAREED